MAIATDASITPEEIRIGQAGEFGELIQHADADQEGERRCRCRRPWGSAGRVPCGGRGGPSGGRRSSAARWRRTAAPARPRRSGGAGARRSVMEAWGAKAESGEKMTGGAVGKAGHGHEGAHGHRAPLEVLDRKADQGRGAGRGQRRPRESPPPRRKPSQGRGTRPLPSPRRHPDAVQHEAGQRLAEAGVQQRHGAAPGGLRRALSRSIAAVLGPVAHDVETAEQYRRPASPRPVAAPSDTDRDRHWRAGTG